MSKNNGKEKKCRICGKTLVGKNKTGVCSACKKKAGDTGGTIVGILGVIGGLALAGIKALTKND